MTVPQTHYRNNFANQFKHHIWKNAVLSCKPYELGLYGELIALDWLTNTGYLVERARGCDLIAGEPETGKVFKVEVKASRMSDDGSYNFSLYKRDHTDHRVSEFLVLLCVTPDGRIIPFVIPVSAALLITRIKIPTDPNHYRGQWAKYCNLPGTLSLNE